MADKRIVNKVPGCPTAELHSLLTLQATLKSISHENMLKLRRNLERNGMEFPVFVWHDSTTDVTWLLDGHHRCLCLKELQELNYEIDPVPVVAINAKNKAHAKKLILLASSHYALLKQQSFDVWLHDTGLADHIAELNFPELSLPELRPDEVTLSQVENTPITESLSVQFIYTKSEMQQLRHSLDFLRHYWGIEAEIDIIMRVLHEILETA